MICGKLIPDLFELITILLLGVHCGAVDDPCGRGAFSAFQRATFHRDCTSDCEVTGSDMVAFLGGIVPNLTKAIGKFLSEALIFHGVIGWVLG